MILLTCEIWVVLWVNSWLLKVGAHLFASYGRHASYASDFSILYIISNGSARIWPRRTHRTSAMPTRIPERAFNPMRTNDADGLYGICRQMCDPTVSCSQSAVAVGCKPSSVFILFFSVCIAMLCLYIIYNVILTHWLFLDMFLNFYPIYLVNYLLEPILTSFTFSVFLFLTFCSSSASKQLTTTISSSSLSLFNIFTTLYTRKIWSMSFQRELSFTTAGGEWSNADNVRRKSDPSDACRPYDADQCALTPKTIRWVRCVPSVRCEQVWAYLWSPILMYHPQLRRHGC